MVTGPFIHWSKSHNYLKYYYSYCVWRKGLRQCFSRVIIVAYTEDPLYLQSPNCILYKWKNHFYEMKGDVGMSLHEKERNKKMPTPRHKVTHNPIPTSLFCFNMLFVCLFVMNALGKANSTTS